MAGMTGTIYAANALLSMTDNTQVTSSLVVEPGSDQRPEALPPQAGAADSIQFTSHHADPSRPADELS
jgi:hypothetical protein